MAVTHWGDGASWAGNPSGVFTVLNGGKVVTSRWIDSDRATASSFHFPQSN